MAWFLNPALTRFRNAVNAAYPRRDKTSDGTIGDRAHQATNSDHNEDPDGSVDAWDMDIDLRSGDDAAAIEHLKRIFQAHESSRYWIHNRQVASRSTGWRRERYDGDNPHDKHVHWNTRESHEDSTAPWPIGGDDMALLDDVNFQALAYRVEALVKGLDTVRLGPSQGEPVWMVQALRALAGAVGTLDEATAAQLRPQLEELDAAIAAVGDLDVDETALAQQLLATLTPAAIAAAIPPTLAGQVADELHARLAG